jgi:hypothetical protein
MGASVLQAYKATTNVKIKNKKIKECKQMGWGYSCHKCKKKKKK